jgi:hypothetical protein
MPHHRSHPGAPASRRGARGPDLPPPRLAPSLLLTPRLGASEGGRRGAARLRRRPGGGGSRGSAGGRDGGGADLEGGEPERWGRRCDPPEEEEAATRVGNGREGGGLGLRGAGEAGFIRGGGLGGPAAVLDRHPSLLRREPNKRLSAKIFCKFFQN